MGASKKTAASIKQDGTSPQILAAAIVDIAAGTRKLLDSQLSRRALLLLIQDACKPKKLSFDDIDAVLEAAASLDAQFLKSKSTK